MNYFLSYSTYFENQLAKIRDGDTRKKIFNILDKLETQPSLQKQVAVIRNENKERIKVYEERRGLGGGLSLRVYYSVMSFVVAIEKIELEGTKQEIIRVYCYGDKKSQKKDISRIVLGKDEFSNKEKFIN